MLFSTNTRTETNREYLRFRKNEVKIHEMVILQDLKVFNVEIL